MLNNNLIEQRLDQIRVSANRLKKFTSITMEEFIADSDNYAIAEHHLRRALEAVFDISRHIIAKKGLGRPESYSQLIEILGQQKILSNEFAKKIKGMAGYRNRLVHEYMQITPEEIYEIIHTKLQDFSEYCKFIIDFLENHN